MCEVNALYPTPAAEKILLTNKSLTAAVIKVDWSSFDAGSGTYNFAATDAAIAPYLKAGKKVALVVWAVSDSAAGEYGNASTPGYIWALLGPKNYVNCTTQAGVQRLPNYLDPLWATNYKKAIDAIGSHYAHNPGILYIRVGLGHGGETIPGAGWQNVFPAGWGVTVASWIAYLKDLLEHEATIPGVQWMVGITPMGNPSDQVPNAIAAVAAPLKIGFGSQGLEKSDLTAQITTANWKGLFAEYKAKGVPLELQTIGPSCPSGACAGNANQQATGPLPPLLEFATANGATVIEIYTADWLIAFDPQNADHAKYGAAYAAAIEKAAA